MKNTLILGSLISLQFVNLFAQNSYPDGSDHSMQVRNDDESYVSPDPNTDEISLAVSYERLYKDDQFQIDVYLSYEHEFIVIDFEPDELINFEIIDAENNFVRRIVNQNSGYLRFDITELSMGTYLLKVIGTKSNRVLNISRVVLSGDIQ